MKTHTLPLITASLLAVRVFGIAAVPWGVALAPLGVMLALALIYLAIGALNALIVKRAVAKMGAQLTKGGDDDDRPVPGLYL